MNPRIAAVAVVVSLYMPTATGQTPAPAAGSFDGTWQITTAIDDGAILEPATIRDTFVADGRITVRGSTFSLTPPGRATPRELAFVLDPTHSPKAIDLAGTQKVGSRGIYSLDGDVLMLALSGPGSEARPTDFSAPAGSGRLLLILHRVARGDSPPPAEPAPAPKPAAAEPLATADEHLRGQLVGTWGHQDDQKVVYNTLNPDGTFSSTTTWKKGFGRLFRDDVRTSGTWKAENGSIIFAVSASTDRELRGQILSLRVVSIDDREAVFADDQNRLRREWKVR